MAEENKDGVFDVSKPGENPPNSTSRPVIVGHKPMVKDPMVSGAEDKPERPSEKNEEASSKVSKTKKVLAPLSKSEKPEDQEAATPAPPEEPAKEPAAEEKEAEEKPEAYQAPKDQAQAAVDAMVERADKNRAKPSKEDEARQAEINKLIEEKKYYVQIGHARHHHGWLWFWVILSLVILASIGFYLAIDGGFIDVGVALPYEFIK